MSKDAAEQRAYRQERKERALAGIQHPIPKSKSGKKLSAFDKGLFVAWDGEGYDIDDKHCLVSLVNSAGDVLINTKPGGLSTKQCMDFMLDSASKVDSRTINITFGFGYDVNMILRDVGKDKVHDIWKERLPYGTTLLYGNELYAIKYRPKKLFGITKYEWAKGKDGKYKKVVLGSILLYDVWAFFQMSFVKTIKTWLQLDQEVLDRIAAKKAERSMFNRDMLDEMVSYSLEECKLLADIGLLLRDYLKEAGLKIGRWDGPGAVAAEVLKVRNIKAYMPEDQPEVIDSLARYAYSGGRIELFQMGHYEGPLYSYDVRSAYPSAMEGLPCLAHGRWEWVEKFEPESFGMWQVSSYYADDLYPCPFFYRSEKGYISYPDSVKGWYWTPEVHAARLAVYTDKMSMAPWNGKRVDGSRKDAQFPDKVRHGEPGYTVHGGWVWRQTCTDQPFAFVRELYDLRALWRTQGKGAEKVLKLALNSLYGKMAQQVGAMFVEDKWRKPPYHQFCWAGYITSKTRAVLYEAMMTGQPMKHPTYKNTWTTPVVYAATDGIMSLRPLDVDIGPGLGQWEQGVHESITAVVAGVNFIDHKQAKFRGMDPGALTEDMVLEAWRARTEHLPVSLTRFVGMGRALASDDMALWRTWQREERSLCVIPHWMISNNKRVLEDECDALATRLEPMMVRNNVDLVSHPKSVMWQDEDEMEVEGW